MAHSSTTRLSSVFVEDSQKVVMARRIGKIELKLIGIGNVFEKQRKRHRIGKVTFNASAIVRDHKTR